MRAWSLVLIALLAMPALGVAAAAKAAPRGTPAGASRPDSEWQPPVAVLPFKNLNDDVDTDWLKLGVAETMLSDLKKQGVAVVERDQVDKALGELLLQGAQGGAEDAAAVKVGTLVGAKTVVVGSFQRAGKQLRINARFVEVETGVVLDTAKTTGAADRVFALQDEIVAKLLGRAPPPRPKPKQPEKQVQAYRLYAMSLAVASDAERVGLLKKSLSLDPAFVYAAEELAALEKRLAEYARTRQTAGAALDRTTLAFLRDPAIPAHEKHWRAGQLFTRHLSERRCRAAIADAKGILEMRIPDPEPGTVGANESALNTIVTCHKMLGQPDLAMQAGEELMRRFPAGAWFKPTERTVREILEWRKAAPERAAKIAENEARLEKLAADEQVSRTRIEELLAETDAELASSPTEDRKRYLLQVREGRLATLETFRARARQRALERCTFPRRLDPEKTRRECRAFVEAYRDDPAAAAGVRQAREAEIEVLAELGRWDEAVPAAAAFLAEPPDGFTTNLRSLVEWHWPADALPAP